MAPEGLWRSGARSLIKAFFFSAGLLLACIIAFTIMALISSKATQHQATSISSTTLPSPDKPFFAIINIEGFIGSPTLNAQTVEKEILDAKDFASDKKNFKGIILKINSGGGYSISSNQIYNMISHYRKSLGIPIYAFVDGVCASGAYMIACASDEIIVTPYSAVGSIGSKTTDFFNFAELMQRYGIKAKSFSVGEEKDPLNPFSPWDNLSKEDNWIQNLIEEDYAHFIGIVLKHRTKIEKATLVSEYGARVFPAKESVSKGLADTITASSFSCFEELSNKVSPDSSVQFLGFKKHSFINNLIENSAMELSKTQINTLSEWTHQLEMAPLSLR